MQKIEMDRTTVTL